MRASGVDLDLMEFIEGSILPRYSALDKAHGLSHVNRVISRSLDLARNVGANLNMAYVVAAYHDLGLEGKRAIHHIISGKILVADQRLRRWFSVEEINIMKEAVEDHRASAVSAPRSIYGKIVAEADRDLEPTVVFRRTIEYGLSHYPQKDKEEQWERFISHMQNKYSVNGYIHLWMPNSHNEKNLKAIRDLIGSPKQLRQQFDRLFEEIVNESNSLPQQ